MMRVYLDASVCNVLLFGEEKEAERYVHVTRLFKSINAGQVEAVVSLYTVQEICMYCYNNFPPEMTSDVSRLAVRDLLDNEVKLIPLLTRMERLVHSRRFTTKNASDESHVIAALLNECEAIVAYDEHFRDSADVMPYLRPEELLARLKDSQGTNSGGSLS